jgi:hypothetical protein
VRKYRLSAYAVRRQLRDGGEQPVDLGSVVVVDQAGPDGAA